MLRLSADVNGRPIGYIYIHNRGLVDKHDNLWSYDAAYWNPEKPLESIFGMEEILHFRDQGWMPLVRIVLSSVIERYKW